MNPEKCPVCGWNTLYNGACIRCWWEEPDRLRRRAEKHEEFLKGPYSDFYRNSDGRPSSAPSTIKEREEE